MTKQLRKGNGVSLNPARHSPFSGMPRPSLRDRPGEAFRFWKKQSAQPLAPAGYYFAQGTALRETGRLEEAAASYKKAIERSPIVLERMRILLLSTV